MFLGSAEASTSSAAPWVNWVTRPEDPAKENSTDAPGLSVLNCSPILVKDFFNEAAAKTMIFPVAAALLDEPPGDVAGDDESFDEPQPLTSANDTATTKASSMKRFTCPLPELRQSRLWP